MMISFYGSFLSEKCLHSLAGDGLRLSNQETICSLLVMFSWKSMFTVTWTNEQSLVRKQSLQSLLPSKNHLIWGHGDELDLALNILGLGNHPVLVGDPVAVLLHVLLHPVVLCVEDVATISEHTRGK